MAFKFNCEHCGEELLVHYLRKGEEAQCTGCNKLTTVSETAEHLDLGKKPVPRSCLGLPIKQDEVRRQELTREEIANTLSVKVVGWVLNVVWYAVLLTLVMTIAFRLAGSAFFMFGPYVDVDAKIRFEMPIGHGEDESIDDSTEPVVIGYNQTAIRVPWKHGAGLILADSILNMAIVLIIVYFLRRIFKAIRAGKPFTKRCAIDVRYVGYVIAISGPIWGLFKIAQAVYFSDLLCIEGVWVDFFVSLHPKTVFIGLVIVAIAHLFELAARIQREQELTI